MNNSFKYAPIAGILKMFSHFNSCIKVENQLKEKRYLKAKSKLQRDASSLEEKL